MAKSNKFTIRIDSAKGLTAAQSKRIEAAINSTVTSSLAALDLKGTSKKIPGLGTKGKYFVLKDVIKGR